MGGVRRYIDFLITYPYSTCIIIPFGSDPSPFLFFGAVGHVIWIFQDMNVTSPEYLSR